MQLLNMNSTTLDLSKKSGTEKFKRFSFLNSGSIEEQDDENGNLDFLSL